MFLMSLTMTGCEPAIIEISPPPAGSTLKFCEPEVGSATGAFASPWANPPRLGASAVVMSVGSSPSALDDIRLAVIGAPGREDNDDKGFVEVIEASPSQHELMSVSTRSMQITPPSGGTEYQFGLALSAGNINDCRIDSGWDHACGQELLVGAPDTYTYTQGGEVYVYEPNNDLSVDTVLQLAEVLSDPAASLSGEFGYAIAVAPSDVPPPTYPWETGDITPSWVAVGAPGGERVEIFTVDPAAAATGASAFTWVAALANPLPTQCSGFGASLATANLDHDEDGFPELVVAAPDDVGGGMAFVYRGVDPSTGALFATVPEVLTRAAGGLYPTSVLDDGFGLALATGNILIDDPATTAFERDALLVGAPTTQATDGWGTTYPSSGAVCQFVFSEDGASPSGMAVDLADCRHNVFLAADEEYGAAIAFGDFGAVDDDGSIYSDAAHLRDIAIGAPGGGFGRGYVEVYVAQEDGFDISEFLTVLDDPGGSAGHDYGRTIVSGYVGETTWADVLVGAPGNDKAHLTRAIDTGTGGCPDLDGGWMLDGQKFNTTTLTFASRETEILLWDEGGVPVLYFQDPLTFNIVDGTGNICQFVLDGVSNDMTAACDGLENTSLALGAPAVTHAVQTIEAGTRLDLGSTCSAAFDGVDTYTWTGVPVGHIIEDNIDDRLWPLIDSTSQGNLLNTVADITVELSSHPPSYGTTGTVDILIDWRRVWANINITGCNMAFAADCTLPAPNSFTGLDELPAPTEHSREQVCED